MLQMNELDYNTKLKRKLLSENRRTVPDICSLAPTGEQAFINFDHCSSSTALYTHVSFLLCVCVCYKLFDYLYHDFYNKTVNKTV